MDNFVVAMYKYGKLLLNKNCNLQLSTILATGGVPHTEQELQNMFKLVDTLPDGAIFVDAGANVGLVTLPVASHTKGRIKIISFEPQRMLFNCICGSVALNEFYNVFPYNKAVGDNCEFVSIPDVDYTAQSDYGTVSVSKEKEIGNNIYNNKNIVECITIDSLDLPRLDFLKVDVEGFELNVIRGASETIGKFKPYLWVEYNIINGQGVGLENVQNCLNEICAYEYYVVDMQNVLCVPKK